MTRKECIADGPFDCPYYHKHRHFNGGWCELENPKEDCDDYAANTELYEEEEWELTELEEELIS